MKNIMETAIEAGNFKILIKAVFEADLFDTLSGEGPFTIFAPTDDAFTDLSKKTLDNMIKDKEKLTEILSYHVIPSKVMSKEVIHLKKAVTANGKEIKINNGGEVKIDQAKIIQKDIECTNGVIHVIDQVLIPK